MFKLLFIHFLLGTAFACFPPGGDVVELTSANFDQLVAQSNDVWIVEFYTNVCGHCKDLAPEFTKAANVLKGIAKVGAINVDNHKALGEKFGVDDFPTVSIFGADKTAPDEYYGAHNAEQIVKDALNAVKDNTNAKLGIQVDRKRVIVLTDENFDRLVVKSKDHWLVEFYAPWCGYCKVLEPHYVVAAAELYGKVRLGQIDCTINQLKSREYGIRGYPTVKYFGPGNKDIESVSDYTGGRTSAGIVMWATNKITEEVSPPKIAQLVDLDSGKAVCLSTSQCVVAMLPALAECNAECRNGYLDVLKVMGEKYKKKLWGWLWFEAGTQPGIEPLIEFENSSKPSLAVVNIKTKKYATLKGSFSNTAVDAFLSQLASGQAERTSFTVEEMPEIVATKLWNGKDDKDEL